MERRLRHVVRAWKRHVQWMDHLWMVLALRSQVIGKKWLWWVRVERMTDRIRMIVLRLWHVLWILSVEVSRIDMSSMRTRNSSFLSSAVVVLAVFLLSTLNFLSWLSLEVTLGKLGLPSFGIPFSDRVPESLETSWPVEGVAGRNLVRYLIVHSVRIVHVRWRMEAWLVNQLLAWMSHRLWDWRTSWIELTSRVRMDRWLSCDRSVEAWLRLSRMRSNSLRMLCWHLHRTMTTWYCNAW